MEPAITAQRIRIFDTTLRDGEQSPGATMSLDEKLEVATALADLGRGRDRGRIPDRLARRSRRGPSDRADRARRDDRGAGPLRQGRHRRGDRGAPPGGGPDAARLLLHLGYSSPASGPPLARASVGADRPDGPLRAQRGPECRVVGDGRHAHRSRLSLPRGRSGRARGCDDDQPARYGRLHPSARVCADVQHRARLAERAGAELRSGRPQRAQPTTTSAWRPRTRSRRSRPGRGRSR